MPRRARSCRPRLEALECRTVPTVTLNHAYPGLIDNNWIPPDTTGAVGPSNFVEAVNLQVGLYNKSTGGLISQASLTSGFFSALGGVLQGSDPVVTYDTYINRFVVGMIDFNSSTFNPSRFDLAISKTSTPATLTTADWNFYRYDMTRDSFGGPFLNDYPKLGYTADAIVVSFNEFTTANYSHTDTLAINKSNPASSFQYAWPTGTVSFPGLSPAVIHDGTAGGPEWLVGSPGPGSTIKLYKMANVLSSTPTITTYNMAVNTFSAMSAPRQPGGTMSWTFDTRVFNAAVRNNLLVAAHGVKVGTDDVARWYEFNIAGATPTLVQQGNASAAGTDGYFPTIDINTANNLGMTFIQSSSTAGTGYMSMYVTGRSTSDPLGTMQTPVVAFQGTTNYTISRAGDYSATTVDPSNGTTFWSANEYKSTGTYYNTGFASFDLSGTATATHYGVTASANPVTAGTGFTVTVRALDGSNNVVPGYRGTVHFTSTDSQASLPANYTFTAADNGVHTFPVTLKTAGNQTITGTDTVSSSITGNVAVTVNPAAANHLDLSAPSSTTAGAPFSVTVTARDMYGNVATGYAGTVSFSSTDPYPAFLPGPYTFVPGTDHGTHTFTNGVVLFTAPFQTVIVNGTGVTGRSVGVTVNPAAADRLDLSAPASTTAGAPFSVTVTARDMYGNVATGYAGTVSFSSTDPYPAILPGPYTFVPGTDHGTHTFTNGVTLFTAPSQTVTVTGTGIPGSQRTTIRVNPAALDHFSVTSSADGSGTVAGTPFDVTVTAQDAYGNTVTGYLGTVTFSSGDPYGASLPPDYTFQPSDQGQATFPGGATLYTAGVYDVTAADTGTGIAGSDFVSVTAAPAAALAVIAPSTATSGVAFDVTVVAQDPYGNTDTNYQGTITFTTSDGDPGVILPPDYTFQPSDQGQVTFPGGVTLITPGDQTVTATDTGSGITGTATVTVTSPAVAGQGNRPTPGLAVAAGTPETARLATASSVAAGTGTAASDLGGNGVDQHVSAVSGAPGGVARAAQIDAAFGLDQDVLGTDLALALL